MSSQYDLSQGDMVRWKGNSYLSSYEGDSGCGVVIKSKDNVITVYWFFERTEIEYYWSSSSQLNREIIVKLSSAEQQQEK